MIESIYSDYFQKSSLFLYPLLGFPRLSVPVERQTYMEVDDLSGKGRTLMAVDYFTDRPTECTSKITFDQYLIQHIKKNKRFVNSEWVNENTLRVIFDLSDLCDDVKCVKAGKYSMISPASKKKLLNFFPFSHGNQVYLMSFLFPERYMETYASILDVKVDLLKRVGELCDRPDLEKERVQVQSFLTCF